MTSGVFPEPPKPMFPTEITGSGAWRVFLRLRPHKAAFSRQPDRFRVDAIRRKLFIPWGNILQ
jgi:hypothetical protein